MFALIWAYPFQLKKPLSIPFEQIHPRGHSLAGASNVIPNRIATSNLSSVFARSIA
jgi:hypothetical protein